MICLLFVVCCVKSHSVAQRSGPGLPATLLPTIQWGKQAEAVEELSPGQDGRVKSAPPIALLVKGEKHRLAPLALLLFSFRNPSLLVNQGE